jgi:hypothetical protein
MIKIGKKLGEIAKEVLKEAGGDIKAALYALEDGNFLSTTTYTEQQVEVAYDELKKLFKKQAAK